MLKLGYSLSSEEFGPEELVRFAEHAESTGFEFALISYHFYHWTDRQGNSPFVGTVLGAIASRTSRMHVGTGVTCPLIRIHPALVAQAAATCARLMPGRFFLGVGTGENLNEHVIGGTWPPPEIRLDMLEEAVGVVRSLLEGGEKSHHGRFYEVVDARLYTLPDQPVPVYVAATAGQSGKLAGRVGDGLICSSVPEEAVRAFNEAGGSGKPRIGQVTVCWAPTEEQGIETALESWPVGALGGAFKAELPRPAHFQEVTRTVRPEDIAKEIACGPDPRKHLEAIGEYVQAGFDHVYVHQVGPDQDGFFRFCEREVLPNLRQMAA
jgi:coenzyme F420-dependent glucose-6-phosphate dehydrogenase